MTKEQLVKLLVDNFKDEKGFVNLSGLDLPTERKVFRIHQPEFCLRFRR